ncbi:MAG TPA: hypothetical protein VD905_11160 [Flavobacteriales bacterium]|nr:hypothetical protein [Flavobacteriales bacterium]
MKKLYPLIPFLVVGVILFFSCGGGGVSEQFTKELNEFETAWDNTAASFTAVMDSVRTVKQEWTGMESSMKVADTLTKKLTDEDMRRLDSLKANCKGHAESSDNVLKKMEAFKTGWDKETSAFKEWKDKVLKGLIDIETAKRDMKVYKGKLEEAAEQSDKAYDELTELKNKCQANCKAYDDAVLAIAQRPEENRRRGR